MSSFKDSRGRDWAIFISASTIKRVRTAIGFDLQNLMGPSEEWSAIDEDAVKCCEVIAEVIRPALDVAAVPVDTFLEAMSGDAIDNAREALLDAVEACAPPVKRAAMKEFRAKYREVMAKAYAQLANDVGTVDAAAVVAHASEAKE